MGQVGRPKMIFTVPSSKLLGRLVGRGAISTLCETALSLEMSMRPKLPYTIYISGFDKMPAEVRAIVKDFVTLIKGFQSEGHEADVVCDG
jgi:hypothetical protein